ncbi:type I restriction endonuclease subunit M [Vibrio sp. 10N.286.49.C2]|nr:MULTISPECIES: N-6 DNA methylase [unclassified Vibrio]OCH60332.1 type I restriction endonuclease subunit M [Vibrio splendidus]PMH36283.1 type I restriction endonuclease subunit M [Vibrio sp. 10N.286.49.C2]PMH53399.1 type I restriction endonuclease subunit M [Vibrio sp. 10N.286.49.B1]
MTIEHKHTLWNILDNCRGALPTRHCLDIITTIATCASLDQEQFNQVKEMGASALVPALEDMLKEQKANYPIAFEAAYDLRELPDQKLSNIVYNLAGLSDLAPLSSALREALIDNSGKLGGEFGSSTFMTTLLPALIGEVKDKTLLDATCGLARMTSLINTRSSNFQEHNPDSASLSLRLLLIEEKKTTISVGNSLLGLKQSDRLFDLVVMEPPLGLKLDAQTRKEIQKLPYIIDEHKAIPTSGGDALWIQLALHHLNDFGKAYLVLPQGILFRGGYDGYIREHLLNNELVDKVIALPSGAVNGTNIEPVLLVLNKAKEKGSPIRFVDLRHMGIQKGKPSKLDNDDLKFALNLIEGGIEDTQKARNITIREIRQTEPDNTGNNLNVSRYVQTQEEITLPTEQEQIDLLLKAKQRFDKFQEELLTQLNQQ